MTETPCTMLGGPLDGEMRVLPDAMREFALRIHGGGLDDEWAMYTRVKHSRFACAATGNVVKRHVEHRHKRTYGP